MTDPKTAREVFIEAVEDGLNGTPNARHPVQFEPFAAFNFDTVLLTCSLCKALVSRDHEDGHRDWHDKHVAEHDRIMQQASHYKSPPTYG